MNQPRYYQIENMRCGSCAAKIESLLSKTPDVEQASVNFADRSLMVVGTADDQRIVQALADAGYTATLKTTADDKLDSPKETAFLHKTSQQFIIALIIGLLLMVSDYIYHFIPDLTAPHGQLIWLGIGIVSLAAMLFSGGDIYHGAWKMLLKKSANMDSLIALGTGAAWVYSMVVVLFYPFLPTIVHGVYFDTAVFIIALVKLGSILEARARGKTSAAISHLIGLQPKTAIVIQDQQDIELPIDLIKTDMLIRIRPGGKIPLDGVIIEGESIVDEAMLTGEAMPVRKQIHDKVFAGTLNKSGAFIFKVSKVGSETALAKIIALVKQAQTSKPAIGRLADKIAAVFVPIVLGIAIITACVWYFFGPAPSYVYAFVTAVTVLVIACPCALGLGTPISLMIGIGNAARQGILIRNGNALQTSGKLTTVVLDKTGTITKGTPEVTDVFCYADFSKAELVQLAAAVEKNSEHPLAEAIMRFAGSSVNEPIPSLRGSLRPKQSSTAISNSDPAGLLRHFVPRNDEAHIFENFAGKGILATYENKKIIIGNKFFMLENKIDLTATEHDLAVITGKAATPVFIAIDAVLAGLFAITDPVKDDSKAAIQQLQAMGIEVLMLTGDHAATAKTIASQVGVNDFIAECLPDEKHTVIKNLQAKNKIVAMVGDGINDAPALTQADVGFAIGAGTDVAIESADVVLMANSLQGVVHAIGISKATMRNIKQNLVGAFAYNIIGIPIAAGVLYPAFGILLHPIIAGAAMAASSLTIVLNANRLRKIR